MFDSFQPILLRSKYRVIGLHYLMNCNPPYWLYYSRHSVRPYHLVTPYLTSLGVGLLFVNCLDVSVTLFNDLDAKLRIWC
jgi:hypothetical protein